MFNDVQWFFKCMYSNIPQHFNKCYHNGTSMVFSKCSVWCTSVGVSKSFQAELQNSKWRCFMDDDLICLDHPWSFPIKSLLQWVRYSLFRLKDGMGRGHPNPKKYIHIFCFSATFPSTWEVFGCFRDWTWQRWGLRTSRLPRLRHAQRHRGVGHQGQLGRSLATLGVWWWFDGFCWWFFGGTSGILYDFGWFIVVLITYLRMIYAIVNGSVAMWWWFLAILDVCCVFCEVESIVAVVLHSTGTGPKKSWLVIMLTSHPQLGFEY